MSWENPQSAEEALTQALVLNITAPSEQRSSQMLPIVEQLSEGMSEFNVNLCKSAALYEILGLNDKEFGESLAEVVNNERV
tara:strand:- start:432 stop:674 length:243 start_codon:yes stop_codon:yes gene_type:complete